LSACGLTGYLLKRDGSPWLAVAAITVSILFPMMVVIFLAEPVEIERHAIQLAAQLCLVGWLIIPLLAGKIGTILHHWVVNRTRPAQPAQSYEK
jgi:hypothetical protein